MKNQQEKLTRLDIDDQLKSKILPYCRLKPGEIWEDPQKLHRVGVLDATNSEDIQKLCNQNKTQLIINDPPYNLVLNNKNTKNLSKTPIDQYMNFSHQWVTNCTAIMGQDAHLY
ncbi:MAG: site-specific DNA-methyltransferase, partial [Spirochaetes bacterium]|nr:site-specific DNA-methyltransferase [Spirochaetota bacterium]